MFKLVNIDECVQFVWSNTCMFSACFQLLFKLMRRDACIIYYSPGNIYETLYNTPCSFCLFPKFESLIWEMFSPIGFFSYHCSTSYVWYVIEETVIFLGTKSDGFSLLRLFRMSKHCICTASIRKSTWWWFMRELIHRCMTISHSFLILLGK